MTLTTKIYCLRQYVRAFLFRVLIWAVGAIILIFFVQRAVAHLATSSPCEIKKGMEIFLNLTVYLTWCRVVLLILGHSV
jgi:hypothetical protein